MKEINSKLNVVSTFLVASSKSWNNLIFLHLLGMVVPQMEKGLMKNIK